LYCCILSFQELFFFSIRFVSIPFSPGGFRRQSGSLISQSRRGILSETQIRDLRERGHVDNQGGRNLPDKEKDYEQ
jgi:hypothetical protein